MPQFKKILCPVDFDPNSFSICICHNIVSRPIILFGLFSRATVTVPKGSLIFTRSNARPATVALSVQQM